MAAVDDDGWVQIYDAVDDSYSVLFSFKPHEPGKFMGPINTIEFSQDEKIVYTGSDTDGTIKSFSLKRSHAPPKSSINDFSKIRVVSEKEFYTSGDK